MVYGARRKQHFSYNLFGGESCSVGFGQVGLDFLYTSTEIFLLFRLKKMSKNASFPFFFLPSKLNALKETQTIKAY